MKYGQSTIPKFQEWYHTMLDLLKQPGVQYVGMVDHRTLAHAYVKFVLYSVLQSVLQSVFIIQVGCPRFATANTDNNMKIDARGTLGVECITSMYFYI